MNLAEANRILRLSDSQLAIVRQAAVPLSPSARDRYLKAVAAELSEAERVEKANGIELTEAEMRKLYDAGYDAGVRAVEAKQHGPHDFRNVDGTPAWHEIARFCQQSRDRLREKEREFINDITSRTVWREPTNRQAKWLRSIFYRLGGSL